MPRSRRTTSTRQAAAALTALPVVPAALATQAAELAWAAPQVVAMRMARIALAGPVPNARDRREFQRMGSEKVAAFQESWNAMALHAFEVQQQMALQWMRAMWFPWAASSQTALPAWHTFAHDVLGKGLAPVHRRAMANAQRLRRLP